MLVELYRRPGIEPPLSVYAESGETLSALIKRVARLYSMYPLRRVYEWVDGELAEVEDPQRRETGHIHVVFEPGNLPPLAVAAFALFSVAVQYATRPTGIDTPVDYRPTAANRMRGQRNESRLGERVPESFGEITTFPYVLIPPIEEHHGREMTLIQLFTAGWGRYQILEARLGETTINEIDGCSMTKYAPGSIPAKDFRVVRDNANVRLVPLLGTDEAAPVPISTTFYTSGSEQRIKANSNIWKPIIQSGLFRVHGSASNDGYKQYISGPALDGADWYIVIEEDVTSETTSSAELSPGMPVDDEWMGGVWWFYQRVQGRTIAGAYDHLTITDRGDEVPRPDALRAGHLVQFDPDGSIADGIYTGWYVIESRKSSVAYRNVGNNVEQTQWAEFVVRNLDGTYPNFSRTVTTDILFFRRMNFFTINLTGLNANWSDWYTVGSTKYPATEIWTDFDFPQGIWFENLGEPLRPHAIKIDWEYRTLDQNGDPGPSYQGKQYKFVDRRKDPLRFTRKKRRLKAGVHQIRYKKQGPTFVSTTSQTYSSVVNLTRVAGASMLDTSKHGPITTIKLHIRVNQTLANLAYNAFNVDQVRKLKALSANGNLSSRNVPTKRAMDALYYVLTSNRHAGIASSRIDARALGQLQKELDGAVQGPELGEFSGTFDREEGVDTEILSILGAVRCVGWRRGTRLQVRYDKRPQLTDEHQYDGMTLFNRMNVIEYRPVLHFARQDAYDCVIVPWRDRESRGLLREWIYPYGVTPVHPKRIKVTGIYNHVQADNRAQFEWRALTSRMDELELITTAEGALVEPYEHIRVVRLDLPYFQDGQVMSYDLSSQVMTLDRDIDWSGLGGHGVVEGGEHSIVLRNKFLKNVSEHIVTPGPSTNQVVIQTAGGVADEMTPSADRLRNALFAIGPVGDHLAETWLAITSEMVEHESVRARIRCVSSDYSEYVGDSNKLTPAQDKLIYGDTDVPPL